MIYFTAYANQKFTILNNHQVFIRKEQVEEVLRTPEKQGNLGKQFTAEKEGIKVIYEKETDHLKVITFYPIK